MSASLPEALASTRYPADAVVAALGDRSTAWRVLSAVRAEGEDRFRAAALALLRAEPSPSTPRLGALARPRIEGLVGVLEERPCDHLCAGDVTGILGALEAPTHDDLVDVFLVGELGDEAATERLGARLAASPRDALPSELVSDPVGVRRLYRAIRARFSGAGAGPLEELDHLVGLSGARLIAAGAAELAAAHGRPWPEVVPLHNRGGTNASRALAWAALALGDEGLKRGLKAILGHARTKGRIACAGLPWDERFDGVGGGTAVRVRRCGKAVVIEVGKAHPQIAALPNRPRRSVKVVANEAKAAAEFAKRVVELSAKHGLEPVDPARLGPALERSCASLPSDFAVALIDLDAPLPELFWFRGDPEATRRAIAAGRDPATETTPKGAPLLAEITVAPWDVQRAEVLVDAGATLSSPARLTEAAARGELALARLLLRAGAPIEAAAIEAAAPWPRLERLLRDAERAAR
jgi:hypothetical protein